jgi:outer membrane protein assembly factor BamB
VLARYAPSGDATVTANPAGGFFILDSSGDDSQAVFYDAAGHRVGTIPAAEFDPACGVGDTGTGDHRIALTEHVATQDAEGIHAARYSLRMQALNPRDGTLLWQKTLIPPQTDEISCGADSSGSGSGDVENQTTNGKWVLHVPAGAGNEKHPKITVVDTGSGKNRVDMKAVGLLGNYVVDGDPTGNSDTDQVTDPATGKAYGSLRIGANGRGIPFGDGPLLAAAGMLPPNAETAVNRAGTLLMTVFYSGGEPGSINAYQLPAAKKIWSVPVPEDSDYQLVADGGGKLLVTESSGDGDEGDRLVALDEHTGKEAWHVPSGQVCGLTAEQLLLSVNDQLAVIDVQTGQQLSYSGGQGDDSAEQGGECPDLRPGGIAVSQDAGGITITQQLEP